MAETSTTLGRSASARWPTSLASAASCEAWLANFTVVMAAKARGTARPRWRKKLEAVVHQPGQGEDQKDMHRDLVSAERLVGHRGLLLDEVVRHEGAVFCVPAEANVVIARIPNSVSTDVSVTPTATLSTAEQEPAKRRRKTRPVAGCQAPWRVRSPDSWRIEAAADRLADVLARAPGRSPTR